MYILTVYYPYHEGYRFDWEYYEKIHLPLVVETLKDDLLGRTIERGLTAVNGKTNSSYIALGRFSFASLESLQSALSHILPIKEDIAKFTDISPLIDIAVNVEEIKS